MTAIIRPRPWAQQPQFVTGIDRSNPFNDGLLFLASAGSSAYDATGRYALSPTSAPLGAGPGGIAWKLSGGTGSVLVQPSAGLNPPLSYTIFAVVRSTDATGAQFICNKNYDGSSVNLSLSIGGAGAINGLALYNGEWKSSSVTRDIRGDNTLHVVVGTNYFGSELRYYIDGVIDSTFSGASLVTPPTSSNLYIGRYENDSASFRGDIYSIGIVGKCWTASEVKAFSDSQRWQTLRPRVT